jgi:hypothetical protein
MVCVYEGGGEGRDTEALLKKRLGSDARGKKSSRLIKQKREAF